MESLDGSANADLNTAGCEAVLALMKGGIPHPSMLLASFHASGPLPCSALLQYDEDGAAESDSYHSKQAQRKVSHTRKAGLG